MKSAVTVGAVIFLSLSTVAAACVVCIPRFEAQKPSVSVIIRGKVLSSRIKDGLRIMDVSVATLLKGQLKVRRVSMPTDMTAGSCCMPVVPGPIVATGKHVFVFLDSSARPLFWSYEGRMGDLSKEYKLNQEYLATLPPPAEPKVVPIEFLRGQYVMGIDDYPPIAIRERMSGRVTIAFEIDSGGRPQNCRTVISSSYPLLDSTTCGLFVRRARYKQLPQGGKYRGEFTWDWKLPRELSKIPSYDQLRSLIEHPVWNHTVAVVALRILPPKTAYSKGKRRSNGSVTSEAHACRQLISRGSGD